MQVPIEIDVTTPGGEYRVCIGSGLLGDLGRCVEAACPAAGGYALVTDSTVGGLYGPAVLDALRATGRPAVLVDFPAGEPNKTPATYLRVLDAIFAAAAPDRQWVVAALGGGVPGDLGGFVAATLLRGVRFVQLPTTLLAAVDSSVGGKTGVDHATGKNLIGAFHQPRGVFMDTDVLATLAPVEIASGLAECVKHACIRRPERLDWLAERAAELSAGDPAATAELIAWNVAIKAEVVSADERETGQRAHLNFGHTIGHAIEAVCGMEATTPVTHTSAATPAMPTPSASAGVSPVASATPASAEASPATGDYLRHGHCVALGMVAACRIALRRGVLAEARAAELEALLERFDLPTRLELPETARLLEIMRRDKKNARGRIRFVLPEGDFGRVGVVADVSDEEIADALAYLRGGR